MESGIYHYRDNLTELKLKVVLKLHENSNLHINVVNEEAEAQQEQEQEQDDDDRQSNNCQGEKMILNWQEKIFSNDEIKWYGNKQNCSTQLDEMYQQKSCSAKMESRRKLNEKRRLYTYVDCDCQKKSDKEKEIDSVSSCQLRNRFNNRKLMMESGKNCVKKKVCAPNCCWEENGSSHRVMFIMADLRLNQEEEDGEEEEVLLCSIHSDGKDILILKPDFNSSKKPFYQVQNRKLETFHFTIEHASNQIKLKEREKEKKYYKQECLKSESYLKSCLDDDQRHFQIPLADVFKVFLFGEIVKATNFEENNLFIFYNLHLPKGWVVKDSSWLTGLTQTSSFSAINENCVFFSYPFEGELNFPSNQLQTELEDGIEMQCPTLLLEVSSRDSWGCVRTRGYAFLHLPVFESGCHIVKTITWKPVNQLAASTSVQLREFFIGGENQIEDLTYLTVPSTLRDKQLSRLGFNTETSGEIEIKINIVHQSRSFLHTRKKNEMLTNLKFSSSQNSLRNVLTAFQRARENMLKAREKLWTPLDIR